MLYEIAKPVVMGVVRLLWNPTISGTEHIPPQGPVILASNHLAYSDTVFLPGQVRRSVNFLGKSDIFTGRTLHARAAGAVMRGLHVMPVDRSGGSASRGAIDAGLAVLARGEVLGIYPEGTRSPDGRLYRGRTGVARFALASGAPVIPVAMRGAHEAQQGRRYLPRRHPRIHAVLGPAVDVSAVAARCEGADEATLLREVTEAVMEAIQALSGQERVDEYASVVKQRLREESRHGTHGGDDAGAGHRTLGGTS
ncbi:lysophospholipid acyltransferase family protein [Brachybacterium saurashtrense]|uniref:1-acyl-sn-glycerol-3-phosphate acyltransferase n=1 Tax=Brachybacterium saurashtrense TaxID=556288 RepID=A0A345YM13_9MICO|nr:lysophospholipid acyltransferase family protein [Brachybacterium saurashtrense]AXK44965.1 1-acyl-sn-glycerol-3-phosphate acyltransferase [Brachybacterium saurashtrense]RRR21649.1 1-acyl-sn-glycerol-3-phosphate acyltransferase [Brachybacterium saurashtrense]